MADRVTLIEARLALINIRDQADDAIEALDREIEPVSATPWLDIARRDIGIKETPGAGSTARIKQMAATYPWSKQDDEEAWCGKALGTWLKEAGRPIHPIGPRARAWLEYGETIAEPKVGCIAVLWRGSPSAATGHVGFVTAFTAETVELLAGNQGNGVTLATFPRGQVLGFRWPA